MSITMDQVVKRAKDSFGQMFDKSLQDLVRGIRNHKDNETKYINDAIEEIKQELKQENIAAKANAVLKLCYLQMFGYDISWSAFNIIEVMSSNKFTYKRIGYFAASQCFHEGTDVLMLTTNMIRKDLNSTSMYESAIAMSGLSCFINGDLARDLSNDIMTLMTSTRPYTRKRAVLLLYKVFLNYPDALKIAFPRLKEKLEDPDPGVQAAAVNVICELARRNPKNYLGLAPIFFRLMTTSTNNWVLIKIIKLFAALTPLEPRLGKKLIEPLTNLIHSTSATSLLYECINTVIAVLVSISSGLPTHNSSIELCVQKLRILIEDSDQNLKYLGLQAMSKILQTHPKSVQTHNDLIMRCLDDKDESIRLRALDLLSGMVTRKNLMDIVRKLMIHMDRSEGSHYRDELLSKIIEICSQNDYQHVTNFEWYISILVELTRLEGTKHGRLICLQMLDVAVRVESIRPFACNQMAILLENAHVFVTGANSTTVAEVLYAAAWICGEFCSYLRDPRKTLEAILKTKITVFPGHIQSVYFQNILKIVTFLIRSYDNEDILSKELISMVIDKMSVFLSSGDVEAQERASVILNILKTVLKLIEKSEFNLNELAALFDGVLNPVAAKAQRKVAIPNGLDLDAWINDPPSESEDESTVKSSNYDNPNIFYGNSEETSHTNTCSTNRSMERNSKAAIEPTPEELEAQRKIRKQNEQMNPFYLKDTKKSKLPQQTNLSNGNENKQAVSSKETMPTNLQFSLSDQYYHKSKIDEENRRTKVKSKNDENSMKKGKKSSKKSNSTKVDDNDDDIYPIVTVTRGGELPDGTVEISNDHSKIDVNINKTKKHDPHEALDIDFSEKPIQSTSILPKPKEPESKHIENNVISIEKPKKSKKTEKDKSTSTRKTKTKHNNDENVPAESEQQTKTLSPPIPSVAQSIEEKPKKKKTKEKKSSAKTNDSPALLLDIMNDDIHVLNQQSNEQIKSTLAAQSDNLTIEYSINPLASSAQLDVTFILKNQTSFILDHIDIHIIDSMSSKLLNTTSANRISFPSTCIFPRSQSTIHVFFAINAISFSQKLKTAVTYTINKSNEIETDTMEFKLNLPCSQYLRRTAIDPMSFADLMSSGKLDCQSNATVSVSNSNFASIIDKICQSYRLTVVEKIPSATSLYAESILDHPIALLIKSTNSQNNISINGKSTETHFLSNLIEEIKASLI